MVRWREDVGWIRAAAGAGVGSTWIGWGTFERISWASSSDIWRAWRRYSTSVWVACEK